MNDKNNGPDFRSTTVFKSANCIRSQRHIPTPKKYACSVNRLYHKQSALGYALLVYMTIVVAVVTLIPFEFDVPPRLQISFTGSASDVFTNILLFIPLGFFFQLAHGRGGWKPLLLALCFGTAVSCAVEAGQLFLPSRCSSPIDVATNGFGAWLGAAIANRFSKPHRVATHFVCFKVHRGDRGLYLAWLSGRGDGLPEGRIRFKFASPCVRLCSGVCHPQHNITELIFRTPFLPGGGGLVHRRCHVWRDHLSASIGGGSTHAIAVKGRTGLYWRSRCSPASGQDPVLTDYAGRENLSGFFRPTGAMIPIPRPTRGIALVLIFFAKWMDRGTAPEGFPGTRRLLPPPLPVRPPNSLAGRRPQSVVVLRPQPCYM